MLDGTFTLVVGLYTPLRTVLLVDPAMREGVEKGGDLVPRRIRLEDFIYRHADGYLACGPAVVAEIEGEYDVTLRSDRLGLVPHGLPDISIGVSRNHQPSSVRILFVGRLESRKGIDTLLEAVPLLAARGANFQLVVIGDDTIFGPNGTTYREWFEASWPDHQKYVSFLGPLTTTRSVRSMPIVHLRRPIPF